MGLVDITSALTRHVELEHVIIHGVVEFGCMVALVVAPLIDLWDGVYTAKKLHEPIRSHRIRKTVQKIGEYWRLMFIALLVDTFGILFPWYALPYLSVAVTVGIIVIEGKSIWEHARRRKSELVQLKDIASRIIECANEKDAGKLIKAIKEELDKKEECKK